MEFCLYFTKRVFSSVSRSRFYLRNNRMSNVIKICEGTPDFSAHAKQAANELLAGGVIALPTDTLYGIAALAQNIQSIDYIYTIKKRNPLKPLAICVSDIGDIPKWGKVTVPLTLLDNLLPGPVTVVFERTVHLNPNLNPDTDLVGIRIPDDQFILQVTELCNEPLALTSANVSQEISPLDVNEFKTLWNTLDKVYNIGTLSDSPEARAGSTIVDLSVPGFYRIIRRGSAYSHTVSVLQRYNLKFLDNL